MTQARLLPRRPFPPYTYVPGTGLPHPVSHPAGHSFCHRLEPATDPALQAEALRWGIDLFNHGYFWEAHEAWEGLWAGLGRVGEAADAVKGLIHLAAAGVKRLEGIAAGVESHLQRGRLLLPLNKVTSIFGITPASLQSVLAELAKQPFLAAGTAGTPLPLESALEIDPMADQSLALLARQAQT